MSLNHRVLGLWKNMFGQFSIPQTLNAPPRMHKVVPQILLLLADDQDFLALLEEQPTVSVLDFLLTLRIWYDEGLATAYEDRAWNGLIRFANTATSGEDISRARRLLVSTAHGQVPPWTLPQRLKEQAASAEQTWRQGFGPGTDNEEGGLTATI